MADDNTIRVLRPDGKFSRIPASSLGMAMAKGYQLAGNAPSKPSVPSELVSKPLQEYPGRILDRIGENFKAMGDLPAAIMGREKELRPEGRVTALPKAELEAAQNLLKGVLGVSGPGIVGRMGSGEKPENIAGDAAMFFMPGGEEVARRFDATRARTTARELAQNPTKPGSLFGALTRAKEVMDKVDTAAKDIPINWKPAYEWAQKAFDLQRYGYTVPAPIKAFKEMIDSRMKGKSNLEPVKGEPNAVIDQGPQQSFPLLYQDARNFEVSLGAKIPWEADAGGKMNGIMKKMRESLGAETATALKPHGLDTHYLRSKADFNKAYGAEAKWGPFGYFGGKLAGYGTGAALTGHPLILGYAGGKAGESAAGSLVRSIVNAGGQQ